MSQPPSSQWDTIVAGARTLHGAPERTLKPREAAHGTTGREVLAAYERDGVPEAESNLLLGEVLGEGGRGIVRVAVQTSMSRAVAVKAVRPALRSPGPILELLQEAWIAGRLEHPNIIPVYDIARGEDGSPLIVLKRIEGEPWSALLGNPEQARVRLGSSEDDLLEAHLNILIAVCNAIHYAHHRRILHLDLKPENVMVGSHGEVYVVDWGVAAALEDASGKLPLVAKRKGIVGTPSYMAPEMAIGDGTLLDERTDVYLLGAMLYELLAGSPPHGGDTIMAVLFAVVHEQPTLPASAPAELAEICRRAMARDPSERFASAEQLRAALQAFLRHRGSIRLTAQAEVRLAELETVLAELVPREDGAPREDSSPREDGSPRREELFAQVRFGFEQALASWPDNTRAQAGLLRGFTCMIGYELEHGDVQLAGGLATQIEGLSPELLTRLDTALSKRRASLDELEQLRRDQDLRIGQRTRVFVVMLLGALWTVLPPLDRLLFTGRTPDQAFAVYLAVPLASLALLGGLRIWARDSLTRTRINRLVVSAIAIALVGQAALLIAGRVMGLGAFESMVPGLLLIACIIAVTALVVDVRALWVALGYAMAFAVSVPSPEHYTFALAGANLVCVVVLGIIWRPERMRRPI
jgi:serine/threonine protein kinase